MWHKSIERMKTMSTLSRFFLALSTALISSIAVAASAIAAEAPQVSLGRFEPAFSAARPFIATVFVLGGLYVIIHHLGTTMVAATRQPRNAETWMSAVRIPHLLSTIFGVAFLVVLAVFVLYVGLDVLNAALKFIWSVASEPGP